MFHRPELAEWLKTVARVSSASLILEDADDRALIVKASYKSYWTFPGGVIDPGETPLEGAVRETREEVGLVIDPATVRFAWVANRVSQAADTYQFVFRAPLPAGVADKIALQPDEINDYAWVKKSEVLTGDRQYGEVLELWAHDASGYVEQTFNAH